MEKPWNISMLPNRHRRVHYQDDEAGNVHGGVSSTPTHARLFAAAVGAVVADTRDAAI